MPGNTRPGQREPQQRPSKALNDYDDEGKLVPGGYQGSAAATAEDRTAGFANANLLGQALGVGGSGPQAATHVAGANLVEQASAKAGGFVRYNINSPDGKFVAHWFPLYNLSVSQHRAAIEKWTKPLYDQIAVAQALRQKFADQTGFWSSVGNFLSDPLAILGVAGMALSLGAGATLASKQALKDWNQEQGAEAAVKKLDAKIASLQSEVARKTKGAKYDWKFMPDPAVNWELYGNWNESTTPLEIPSGVVFFPVGEIKGIVGAGPLPPDFEHWFKHTRKMLGQHGIRKFSVT